MPELKRIWRDTDPPKPDVYLTRRGNTKNTVPRYWDGENWWQLIFMTEHEVAEGRNPKTVSPWSSKSYEPKPRARSEYSRKGAWHMRVISTKSGGQDGMRWGERYQHYSDTEILDHLISVNFLGENIRAKVINRLNEKEIL